MLTPAQLGQFAVPPNWEVRSQVSFHAPVQEASNDWGAKAPMQNPPRINIVVSRRPAQAGQTAQTLIEALLKELAQGVRGLTVVSSGEMKFADGVVGSTADVALPATPQLRALQRHAFRVDGGIATQLVATVDEQSPKKLEELGAMLTSFKP